MAHETDDQESLFNPGKARWLREKGSRQLSEDQQALLLAMTQLEAEMGRDLSDDEATAVEVLITQMQGFDPEDILTAVRQMVNQPAKPDRKTSWPELKDRNKP